MIILFHNPIDKKEDNVDYFIKIIYLKERGEKEGIPDPRAFKAQSLEEQLRL